MNIFSRPTPATLAHKLDDARAELAKLHDQIGPLALRAEAGDEEGRAALHRHRDVIREAETKVDDLRAAIAAAEREERREAAEGLAKLRTSQLRTVTKHLKARDAAGARYSAAITEARQAFDEMLDETFSASRALPVGLAWPRGAHVAGELVGDCEAELYRVAGYMNLDPRAKQTMPGVSVNPYQRPDEMPVLTAALAADTKRVTGLLRDQIEAGRLAAMPPERTKSAPGCAPAPLQARDSAPGCGPEAAQLSEPVGGAA